MSKISDEKLIVAAVKGDDEAIKLLKNRAKPRIQATLEQQGMQGSGNDVKALESHILEEAFNALSGYSFNSSFQTWIYRIALNMAIQHKNKVMQPPVRQNQGERLPPKAPMPLSHTPNQDKHPPLMNIDTEIRSLVALLNQSSDIQTFSSCSGHPKQGKWNPYGGWISLRPTRKPRRALAFLVDLLTLLDNTTVMKPGRSGHEDADAVRKRYRRIDANDLFCSGVPIVTVGVSFKIFACHPEEARRLQIWKQLITALRDLLTDTDERYAVLDTPAAAAKCLQQALQQLPFVYSAQLVPNHEGYHELRFHTKADLLICQWCLNIANQIDLCLHKIGHSNETTEQNADLIAKWTFSLQPFLNPDLRPLPHLITTPLAPRTREDHLKIWQLIELTVAEQLALTKTTEPAAADKK